MASKIIWSNAALDDVALASEYIARDSIGYATAFVDEVLEAVDTLSIFPEGAAIVPEMDSLRVREIFVRRYRIIFEFNGSRVLIVACIHSARELDDILKTRMPGSGRN
jgi:plasmid stabilization system protein ParE